MRNAARGLRVKLNCDNAHYYLKFIRLFGKFKCFTYYHEGHEGHEGHEKGNPIILYFLRDLRALCGEIT